jgi:hypothetical protein
MVLTGSAPGSPFPGALNLEYSLTDFAKLAGESLIGSELQVRRSVCLLFSIADRPKIVTNEMNGRMLPVLFGSVLITWM